MPIDSKLNFFLLNVFYWKRKMRKTCDLTLESMPVFITIHRLGHDQLENLCSKECANFMSRHWLPNTLPVAFQHNLSKPSLRRWRLSAVRALFPYTSHFSCLHLGVHCAPSPQVSPTTQAPSHIGDFVVAPCFPRTWPCWFFLVFQVYVKMSHSQGISPCLSHGKQHSLPVYL